MIYSYRRVSTAEQYNGPEAQGNAIKTWLNNQPRDEDFCFNDIFDDGVSGSVPLGNRPGGAELLRRLTPGDTVVTAKLDRLFRSVGDAAVTIADWCKRDIKLISLSEGFDMTSPYGKAMAHIMAALAELERDMIRERTKAALAAKMARGERVGGVPYGWDWIDFKLKTNVGEQGWIRQIRQWNQEGNSVRRITHMLNEAGTPAKKGGKWHKRIVAEILARVDV